MLSLKLHLQNKGLKVGRRLLGQAGVVVLGVFTSLTPVAQANITGSDTQNFNPTFSGHDFVTVYSSKTLGAGNYSLGLFANYAINTLPYFNQADQRSDTSRSYNDALTTADMSFGFGLFDNLDIGVMAPYIVHQHVSKKNAYHGQFAESGNTEVRIGAKLRLWHNDATGVALVGSANINRIEDNPYTGKKDSPSFNGEIVADHRFGEAITIAGNAGYRFRNSGTALTDALGNTPIKPMDNEIIGSAAFKYRFSGTGTNLIVEAYGSKPNEDSSDFSPRQASTYEGIGGVKQEFKKDWAVHFGVGTEIVHSVSSPDLRIYTGINWTPVQEKPAPVAQKKPEPIRKVVQKIVVVKPQAVPRKPDELIVLRDVLFRFNSAEIETNQSLKSLHDLAKLVTGPKGLEKLIIEGHTCAIGSDKYNFELSLRRAQSIKAWIVKNYHVDPNKINAVGYGESQPIASNSTPSGRRLNRRVEFKVYHAVRSGIAQK